METQSTVGIEQAWHLLTLLARLGRPSAPPTDLSSRSTLSPAIIKHLCRIPCSPLRLTADGHVAASATALSILGQFVAISIEFSVPRAFVNVNLQRRVWRNVEFTYTRKRKVASISDDIQQRTKKMFVEDKYGVNQLAAQQRDLNAVEAAQTHTMGINNLQEGQLFATTCLGYESFALKHEQVLPLAESSGALPSLLSGNGFYMNEYNEAVCGRRPEPRCCEPGILNIERHTKYSEERCRVINNIREPKLSYTLSYTIMDGRASVCMIGMETCSTCNLATMAMQLDKCQDKVPAVSSFIEVEKEGKDPCTSDLVDTTPCCIGNLGKLEVVDHQLAGEVKSIVPFSRIPQMSKLTEPLFAELTSSARHLRTSFRKPRNMDDFVASLSSKSSVHALENVTHGNYLKHEQSKRDEKRAISKKKSKRVQGDIVLADETMEAVDLKNLEPILYPSFEDFIVEEEEGSGGYGTVYRARRKIDGKVVAVKCSHAKAHLHHVVNEHKMLQRFGGHNCVIPFEGYFKSGELECFILEHVEHDRPEVLRREINLFELQWYGYCLFRALASLHSKGVVHRDVKPGNFLFSRKVNKGYLIDFNLANDLHHKFLRKSRSVTNRSARISPPSNTRSSSCDQSRRVMKDGQREDTISDIKGSQMTTNVNRQHHKDHAGTLISNSNRNNYSSQAADGSGVTSTKDLRYTTTSGDRLKQPIPYKGRKQLIKFLHDNMNIPSDKSVAAPVLQRKRVVAAPLEKIELRPLILTPMPLQNDGRAVAGAGMFKNKGQKKEGPCVGTKGFRAPEVLLKSFHQGCKLDVWSAGVTLLYLIIGRSPFGGDPEQNIKDIANLRGSEDLWEVAKLHNCESSFPLDLLDVKCLQSTNLRKWCEVHTRRPDFLQLLPDSLFDLVDKCLTVNPRLRITSEDALLHDFFKSCHDSLKKQRLLRKQAAAAVPAAAVGTVPEKQS